MLPSHPIIYSSCQSLPYSPRWHKHWEFMERALWPEWRSCAPLDTYYPLCGNFIDTANTHNSEESERLIGEWMEKRRIWDQWLSQRNLRLAIGRIIRKKGHCRAMLLGTWRRACIYPSDIAWRNWGQTTLISFTCIGELARWFQHERRNKSWADEFRWDFATSAEVMRHLHAFVMSKQVVYLDVSQCRWRSGIYRERTCRTRRMKGSIW